MATIEKHGPSWRVRLDALPDGRRPSKTFRTQAEARAWLREYQAGELADPSEATLAQVLRRYAAEVSPGHKGERWEVVRLNKLARHPMAATPIQKLTTAAIAAWRDERLKQVAPASVRGSQPSSAPTIDRDEPSKGAACRSARARPLAAQGSPMAQALLPIHPFTPNFAQVIGPGFAFARLTRATAFDLSRPRRSASWSALKYCPSMQ